MRYNILILILILIFTACSDKPIKKKKKVSKAMEFIAGKVNSDSNLSLVDKLEKEGLVVDGSKDKKLLDNFELAMAKVIMEDGVYVPTCQMISDTKLLSLDECEEITNRYFSYYELYGENGEKNKLVSIGGFKEGVNGEDVVISEDKINYQSESLDDLESKIDLTDDINKLKKLSSLVKAKKNDDLNDKLENKIKYVKEKNKIQKENKKNVQNNTKNNRSNNTNNENKYSKDELEQCNKAKYAYKNAKNNYENLVKQHEDTSDYLNNNPDNENIANKFDNEENMIEEYQNQMSSAQSEMENCK